MNAITPATVKTGDSRSEASALAVTDPDTLFAYFLGRADALRESQTQVADTDDLTSDVRQAGLQDWTLKRIAAAVAKATGFDASYLLRQMRPAALKASAAAQGVVGKPDPDPAAEPMPPAKLAATMHKALERQAVLPPFAAVAIVLWCLTTWGATEAPIVPRLWITSPSPRCGKSTLLEMLMTLVRRGLKADNVSAAAFFRITDAGPITWLIDEADRFLRQTPDLIGVLNAGHERSGTVPRCEQSADGRITTHAFRCFAPAVLCGIANITGTLRDRAIRVAMARAPDRGTSGRSKPLRYRQLAALRDALGPHLAAHMPAIGDAVAKGCNTIPALGNDRAADNWEPLLAVADWLGGDWPARARAAAVALTGGAEAPSVGELLLADIRTIVDGQTSIARPAYRAWRAGGKQGPRPAAVRWIRSSDIVGELVRMEHRPWPEFRDGRPITPRQLAQALAPFGLEPTTQRVPQSPHPLAVGPATILAKAYGAAKLRVVCRQYQTS